MKVQFFVVLCGLLFIESVSAQNNAANNSLPRISGVMQIGNLFINEFMASNALAYENSDGDYEDWIEIYNASDSPIDLTGYFFTDDLNKKTFYRILSEQSGITTIPAKGFLVFFADEKTDQGADHLDFKLSAQGEKIFLLGKDGITILDSITYKSQLRDVSFSREQDGGAAWVYSSQNTPGSSNTGGYKEYSLPPSVDQSSGLYNSTIAVNIFSAAINDVIRYTLDGTDPTETSEQYTSSIPISQTSLIKARAFRQNAKPSEIACRTFLINTNHTLPVLSLITDPKDLFDPKTGIYVNDFDGRAWERFAELEYFNNGTFEFHQPAGIRIQGNTGPKDFYKKSFRIFFRDEYGNKTLNYSFHPDNPVSRFTELVLRSGYDDSLDPSISGENKTGTLIRDPLITELWRRAGEPVSRSKLSVLYINNEYYGIYDIKESIDENFLKDHFGYSDLDLIRTRWDSTEVTYGNKIEWNKLTDFFQNNLFESDQMILEAENYLDLDNYISLQVLKHAVGYRSWSYGTSFFREKATGAKWSTTIWDTDRCFDNVSWDSFTERYNPLQIYLDNLIFNKLLVNENFKNRFINRAQDLLNTLFRPENVLSIIDSISQYISGEVSADAGRWNNTVDKWNENIEQVKNYVEQHPGIVRAQFQNYFRLAEPAEINLTIAGKGKIKLNSITLEKFPWVGKYFKGAPISLTAVPEPGYKFTSWSDPSLPVNETITISLEENKSLSAVFTKLEGSNLEIIAPRKIRNGQRLPVIVRVRDNNWKINPVDQTPLQINFNGTRTDTTIQVKRGAATGIVPINSNSNFTAAIGNSISSFSQREIEISNNPVIEYSGTLSAGEIIWDNSADRLITSDITIPLGCRLIIKPGTWIYIKKYVNLNVRGEIKVEGAENDPVVITSEKWSEPWGGMTFNNASAEFKYCIVLNGGGDMSKGNPTNGGWHTGHQHLFFGMNNSEFNFDNCFFLNSPGKVFGIEYSKVTVTNSVSSFVWHGGEFHYTLLSYTDSHLMNLPNDDHIYSEDIDTDGFHIDYINPKYQQYSVIDNCYFITGKDDAIDHHGSRLKISNCWLEDFMHEGVAASARDTLKIFNTVAIKNDQGFEAGWTDNGIKNEPVLFIDHCVAVDNNVGIRIGDSYTNYYDNFMKVTNTVLYNNRDNIKNYLLSTQAPLADALDISYSITNDPDYDNSLSCITGIPQFDPFYFLAPSSPGINLGTNGTSMGRIDSGTIITGAAVINEIMYNAPADMNTKDWIEIYNPQSNVLDISNWILKDEDTNHSFAIPTGSEINPGDYFVLCADTSDFKKFHPGIKSIAGNFSFGFGGKDRVNIFTPVGEFVDSIAYDNDSPWPSGADGGGYSIELLNIYSDNSNSDNWIRSIVYGGTPGLPNDFKTNIANTETELPGKFLLEQNYPNPFNPETIIAYQLPEKSNVVLKIYDILGREIIALVNETQQPGFYKIHFNGKRYGLSSGVYIYRLSTENFSAVRKLILLK